MDNGNEPIWSRRKPDSGTPESGIQLPARVIPPHRPGQAPPAVKGISYAHLALRNKLVLIGCILLGAIAGTVAVTLTTPVYDAATTVEMVGMNQAFLGMSQVDPQAGTDVTTSSSANMLTQIGLLKSRTLVNRAYSRMNLEMPPEVSAPATFFTRLRSRIPFFRQDPLVQSRNALRMAAVTLSVKRVDITRLMEIHCTSTSPQVAARFVNIVAAEHVQMMQAVRSNSTQQISQWMDSQLEEAKSKVQQANEKLRDFVQKSGMDFFPEQATLASTKMGSLRADVSVEQNDLIAKQTKWELVQKTSPANLPEVLNDGTLQTLKSEITRMRTELAPLNATLTPENPKVKKVQGQINELEKALANEEAILIKRVQSDYEEAVSRQKKMTGAYNAQTRSVAAQADKSSQYAMLKREVELDQSLYNSLLQESNQAALMAMAPTSTIRVVDAATSPRIPSSPAPVTDIAKWALGAGVLGYGLLFLREKARLKKLEKLFDSPGYTQPLLGVPELGVIPSTQVPQPRRLLPAVSWRRWQRDLDTPEQKADAAAALSVLGGSKPPTHLSESFRQTLVSLLRTKPRLHNPVYVITSAGPGEGKTTLSANLARAMAEIGQRVLLVDADLRRPHVHTLLELGDHRGLSDILAGPIEMENLVLDSFIQPTRIENLSVMTHGLTDSATPLFFSDRIPVFVAALRARFDCILFDTAPTLPFPDARLWGRHSDGVVLVVRAGVTTREGAAAACEKFLSDGIPVLGTILNDWNPADSSVQAYYNYGYEKSRS